MSFLLEMIGTIAFAISGACLAAKKKMDVLGVIMMGLVTATGGGAIRDVLLGIHPPAVFVHPVYAIVAMLISLLVFIPRLEQRFERRSSIEDVIYTNMDSVGLAVFTVSGARTVVDTVSEPTPFLILFIGVITGVGGGILRDLFAGEQPYIFKKHFYASASIIGAAVYVLLYQVWPEDVTMALSAILIIVLRHIAYHKKWNLPHC